MSGTSMDGLDCSLIETDGQEYTKIIKEKTYEYSNLYKKNLKNLICNLPKGEKNQILYSKKNDLLVTNNITRITRKFIKFIKHDSDKIDIIGLSGQTIIHNPEKNYSIQLCSGSELNLQLKIPVISNFRQKDLHFGGQGAPIGNSCIPGLAAWRAWAALDVFEGFFVRRDHACPGTRFDRHIGDGHAAFDGQFPDGGARIFDHVPGAAGCADPADDGEDHVLGGAARGKRAVDGYAH